MLVYLLATNLCFIKLIFSVIILIFLFKPWLFYYFLKLHVIYGYWICRSMRKLKYIDNFHHYDLSFKRHCREGKLPNYTVIEPRYFNMLSAKANDDHPKNNVMEGQKLVKEIYEALRSSPQWNEILFLVIYDEHGGYYDHVPTPVDGVPNPDDLIGPEPSNFKFDRLGVRVPVLLISPWIDPGTGTTLTTKIVIFITNCCNKIYPYSATIFIMF